MALYQIYQQPGWYLFGLFVLVLWTVFWQGLGLWYAAKNVQKSWFIVIFLIPALGLFPIIYLLWFRRSAPMEVIAPKRSRKKAQ